VDSIHELHAGILLVSALLLHLQGTLTPGISQSIIGIFSRLNSCQSVYLLRQTVIFLFLVGLSQDSYRMVTIYLSTYSREQSVLPFLKFKGLTAVNG